VDGLGVIALVERRGLSGDALLDLREKIVGERGFVRPRLKGVKMRIPR
jgi:hypothetical protein